MLAEAKARHSRKIDALITLLGDDDRKVRFLARRHLHDLGEPAYNQLEKVVTRDVEGRIRIEASVMLEERRLDVLAQTLETLNRSEFDLEKASFILATIEYPSIDIENYVKQIDDLAQEARKRIGGETDQRNRINLISDFLFHEKGFRGNANAYYDPQNSYLNRVLDRQLGIPISLSAIYLFVARRLDLPIDGVGLPGHFMLRCGDKSDVFYIDAFNGGNILSKQECSAFLNKMGYPFLDLYLAPVQPRDILARMIRNLALIYLQTDQEKKVDVLERIFSDFVTK